MYVCTQNIEKRKYYSTHFSSHIASGRQCLPACLPATHIHIHTFSFLICNPYIFFIPFLTRSSHAEDMNVYVSILIITHLLPYDVRCHGIFLSVCFCFLKFSCLFVLFFKGKMFHACYSISRWQCILDIYTYKCLSESIDSALSKVLQSGCVSKLKQGKWRTRFCFSQENELLFVLFLARSFYKPGELWCWIASNSEWIRMEMFFFLEWNLILRRCKISFILGTSLKRH